jgi:bis(5'-nucleosidyl)-tetraphosphatase
MRREKAAGAIIFSPKRQKLLLLLHREGHWEFPKGKLERGEDYREAMVREIAEETGIQVETVLPFEERVKYTYWHNGRIDKEVRFFLVVSDGLVAVSQEHAGYCWMSPKAALKRLAFPQHRALLEKGLLELKRHGLLAR